MVSDSTSDTTVAHSALLNNFVDATLGFDSKTIVVHGAELERAIGRQGRIDAAAVAAMFQLNTRAADAAGIAVEAPTVTGRSEIGEQLGFAPRESGLAP